MTLEQELEERESLILFLREQLVNATGVDVPIPYKWQRFAGPSLGPPAALTSETKKLNFSQAVAGLNLPRADSKPQIKGEKRVDSAKSSARLTKIDLTGYRGKNVTVESVDQLVFGLKRLDKIRIVDLSRNNINDSFATVLEGLLQIRTLKRVNLSDNELGKGFAMKLGDVLRDELNQLEWLE